MFYICMTIMVVALMATIIGLFCIYAKVKMFEFSMNTYKDVMEPLMKLCDVACKYLEHEIENDEI